MISISQRSGTEQKNDNETAKMDNTGSLYAIGFGYNIIMMDRFDCVHSWPMRMHEKRCDGAHLLHFVLLLRCGKFKQPLFERAAMSRIHLKVFIQWCLSQLLSTVAKLSVRKANAQIAYIRYFTYKSIYTLNKHPAA